MKRIDTDALMAAYQPSLVPLGKNLTAAVFPLMKIFPAEFCLRHARNEGIITRRSMVVESSSGTMALGLAIVCNWIGQRLTIVTDYACDDVLMRRLEDLGAKVERVTAPAETGGYQRARLDRLEHICHSIPGAWWVNQYDNPGNPGAYSEFAALLIESVGRIDCLVGAVGSGGSVCGSGKYLRTLFPEMKVIGVDTFNSVLFGQPDGQRKLRGLGNSLMPRNLDHQVFDEVHWVNVAEAYTATRILHRTTSLFRGATSGAVWLVARYWAALYPDLRVVCIFPDDGNRYTSDVYNDHYLEAQNLWLSRLPDNPHCVASPLEARLSWSMFPWGRRRFDDVMGPLNSISSGS